MGPSNASSSTLEVLAALVRQQPSRSLQCAGQAGRDAICTEGGTLARRNRACRDLQRRVVVMQAVRANFDDGVRAQKV